MPNETKPTHYATGHVGSTDKFGVMKLTLPVPTTKVFGPGWTSFKYEPREVEVVYLTRVRADSTRQRWRYDAGFDHPDAHPEAPRIGAGGLLVARVRRADHPRWVPPAFPDGANSLVLKGLKTPNTGVEAQPRKESR